MFQRLQIAYFRNQNFKLIAVHVQRFQRREKANFSRQFFDAIARQIQRQQSISRRHQIRKLFDRIETQIQLIGLDTRGNRRQLSTIQINLIKPTKMYLTLQHKSKTPKPLTFNSKLCGCVWFLPCLDLWSTEFRFFTDDRQIE
jgi:hypothetical protein